MGFLHSFWIHTNPSQDSKLIANRFGLEVLDRCRIVASIFSFSWRWGAAFTSQMKDLCSIAWQQLSIVQKLWRPASSLPLWNMVRCIELHDSVLGSLSLLFFIIDFLSSRCKCRWTADPRAFSVSRLSSQGGLLFSSCTECRRTQPFLFQKQKLRQSTWNGSKLFDLVETAEQMLNCGKADAWEQHRCKMHHDETKN